MSGRAVHLSKRLVRSLRPRGPGVVAEAWVKDLLSPDEHELWRRLGGADRRHAVGVARHAEADLAATGRATPPVLAAALLHDIGKLESRLGTYGRVVATLAGAATKGEMAKAWSTSSGFTRRVGLYLRHAPIGADMLALAGSDPLTVSWAAEHHLAPGDWSIDPAIGAALKAADDD